MSKLVALARWTQRDLIKLAKAENQPQLLTIPYSHYCELAAWSLDRAAKPYREHGYAPGEHVLPSASRGRASPTLTAVPVVMPDGAVLADSWAIAEAVQGPVDPALKALLDEDLGPLSRQWIYEKLFREANANVWDDLAGVGRGPLFGAAWSVMSPRLTESMRRLFRTRCDEAMKVCDDRLAETLDRANGFLEKSGGEFLGGDAPSISDVAMATLAAPLVLPAGSPAANAAAARRPDAEMQAQVGARHARRRPP
ncbi:L-cystine transmembrane transporter [Aureococcus anophagefferens]|nr:L-cystine transmembrane transporter [Aureococcus anophagefferens]